MAVPKRITVRDLARCKTENRRFAMLTAYDFPTARLLDEAGIPVLLVGDSLGQVVLGYDTTLPVTMDEMLHHCRAVARGARNALLIGDMPFGSYQACVEDGIRNATRFLKEGGMHGVKIEGPNLELTQALELEKAGAFSLVLEAVPAAVATTVTRALAIPTIGIGAGAGCDAQVLVVHDLLGMGASHEAGPKFVKRYANLGDAIVEAAAAYRRDVEAGTYPDEAHSY